MSKLKKQAIGSIDKAMTGIQSAEDGMDWYSIDDTPFVLDGLNWYRKGGKLRRLPLNTPELAIPKGVDYLAWHTAGVQLRFCTDAKEIRLKFHVGHTARMDHMAMVGSMGFDIYIGSGCSKTYAQSFRFNDFSVDDHLGPLFGPVQYSKMQEFTINFPLYSGVDSVSIGLTNGAKLQSPSAWMDPRPIVVYGTSIQQGGCASRPGMCHTNQLSRMLNRPFLNQAYSGSGKGEPEMAKLLAKIKNPAMYILDYDANAHTYGLMKTLPAFIDILREKHPDTPILLVSRLPQRSEFASENTGNYSDTRLLLTKIHLTELEKRRAAGDKNIHFLDGTTLFGSDPYECTVDGVHATDLGFYMVSQRMAPVIRQILEQSKR